jgi:small subunit ribosomal protein S2
MSTPHALAHLLPTGILGGHTSHPLTLRSYWHPMAAPGLLGRRRRTAVVHGLRWHRAWLQALYVLGQVLRGGGHVLVVNTHPLGGPLCGRLAMATLQTAPLWQVPRAYRRYHTSQLSYATSTWIGGTLTNWRQLARSVLTFARFSRRCSRFLVRARLDFPRYRRIRASFGGFLTGTRAHPGLAWNTRPDLILVMHPTGHRALLREAHRLHIPVVALAESDTDLQGVTYPVPIHTDSLPAMYHCLRRVVALAHRCGPPMRK